MRAFYFAAVAVWFPIDCIAAPPPPPPSFIDALARSIVPNQTVGSFEQYAAVFADDLKVSMNGNEVAANKAVWIAGERRRLGKTDRRVEGYVEGLGSILVIDRYDDRSDLPASPTMIFDPRYITRASQFVIGADQLVHAIRIVQTDGLIRNAP